MEKWKKMIIMILLVVEFLKALIGHLASARRICSCAMRSFSWNGLEARNPVKDQAHTP